MARHSLLFGLKLPPGCTFIGSVNWGSIGYSVGALLGALTAAPHRRHLLFVGDGSFQVSAQELSTILRHDHKPVIFLINNGGYTIERGYLGKTEAYNDIANWSYADLPKVFRRDTSARSFVVKTVRDLQNALGAPNDTMIFVESIMDPYDALAPIINSSNKGAELDYGPRGPQHRDNRSSGRPHRIYRDDAAFGGASNGPSFARRRKARSSFSPATTVPEATDPWEGDNGPWLSCEVAPW